MRQKGFTLIELVVAIGIIATMAGMLVPAVQSVRTARNAHEATVTLREIRDAQSAFHAVDRDGDGRLEYAASLEELVAAGVLGADVADGIRQGYAFQTGTPTGSQSQVGYVYIASPMNQGQTGIRGFGGDASGILAEECPPGEHLEIVRGVLKCVRNGHPAPAVRLPIGEASGVAAVDEVNLLAGGIAVDLARPLLTDAFVAEVKAEFDADEDGQITFAELLTADLLAMARRLAATRATGGPSLGDDAALEAILQGMQDRVRVDLGLGTGDETAAPPLLFDAAVGYPRIVLEQAAVGPR